MNLETINTPKTNTLSINPLNLKNQVNANIKVPDENECQMVEAIKKNLNIKDTSSVIKFGTEAQESITKFTDNVLDTVKSKDLSGAGENLQKMIDEMQSIDFASVKATDGFLANLPVIGAWVKRGVRNFVGDFETVSSKVGQMITTLNGQETILTNDITMLDELYKNNLGLVRNLELFILAGQESLVGLYEDVKDLKAKATESGDALDAQEGHDLEMAVDRFEKRINNLRIARVAAIQAAAQIRLAQESDKMIVEDITDVINNTVPMWKRQFVMAISLARQEKALKINKTVKDYTNQQYKDNAIKMNQLVHQVSESYARGVLDIPVMKEVNQLTINSIQKSLTIHKDAKNKRLEAQKELVIMEESLRKTLLDAANSTGL